MPGRQKKNSKKTAFKILIIGGLLFISSFFISHAQVTPKTRQIDFSAYLVNNSNKEIENGTYEIRFAIYDQKEGGSPVWQETQQVKITDGIMNAYLGEKNALPTALTFNDKTYYLGIKIKTDSEMTPRKKIESVPEAINSQYIQGKTIGTNEGDIPQIGKGGKLDLALLPQATDLGIITTGTWEGDPIANEFIETDLTNKTYNGLDLTENSDGFQIAGGSATERILTVLGGNIILDQDLSTTSTPTFGGLSLGGVLRDSLDSSGTAGMFLTSTGSATQWLSPDLSKVERKVHVDCTASCGLGQTLTYGVLADPPVGGNSGETYGNSGDGYVYIHNGSNWNNTYKLDNQSITYDFYTRNEYLVTDNIDRFVLGMDALLDMPPYNNQVAVLLPASVANWQTQRIVIEGDDNGQGEIYVFQQWRADTTMHDDPGLLFSSYSGNGAKYSRYDGENIIEYHRELRDGTTGSDWSAGGGVNTVLVESSRSLDGWGNDASLNSFGNIVRYTLNESQYNGISGSNGAYNFWLGNSTALFDSMGNNNFAVGNGALDSITSNSDNIAIGQNTLNLVGDLSDGDNIALGYNVLQSLTEGQHNIGLGRWTLSDLTNGEFNTSIGSRALIDFQAGSNNVAYGVHAGDGVIEGDYLTLVGPYATADDGLTNATAIGAYAYAGQSNSIVLGGTGAYAVNVGIGTAYPDTAKLKVTGAISDGPGNQIVADFNSGSGNSVISVSNSSNDHLYLGIDTQRDSFIANTNTLSSLHFNIGGDNRMNILANGNIGIGTGNPSNSLEVKTSGVTTSANIRISSADSSGAPGIEFFQTGNAAFSWRIPQITDQAANSLVLSNSTSGYPGTNLMAINHLGNVGIGRYGGDAKFQVGMQSSVDPNLDLTDPNAAFADSFSSGGFWNYHPYYAFDNSLGWMSWWDPINANPYPHWIGQDFGGTPRIITRYSMEASSLAMTLDWQFQASDTGNWAGEEVILDTRTGETINGNERRVFDVSTVGSVPYRYYRIYFTAGGSIRIAEIEMFDARDDAYFMVANSGNVGIGTTDPKTNLDVNGYASIGPGNFSSVATLSLGRRQDTADISAISFNANNTSSAIEYNDQSQFGGLIGFVNCKNGCSSSAPYYNMVIKDDGKVGVGTDSPGYTLDVNGTIRNSGTLFLGTDSALMRIADNYLQINNGGIGNYGRLDLGIINVVTSLYLNGSNSVVANDGSNGIDFATSGLSKMRILNGGNIGIGTTNPGYKLDVAGTLGVGNTAYFSNTVKIGDGSGPYDNLLELSDTGNIYARINSESVVEYRFGIDAASTALRMFTWGTGDGNSGLSLRGLNVGIGITNPSSLLQVGTNGDGTVATANAWNTFSDRKYKENIQTIDNSLSIINQLRGVSYSWKSSGIEAIGFIAQEVEQILPQLVTTDSNGYKSLDYSKFTPILVNAVNEQQIQINSTITQLNNLDLQISTNNTSIQDLQDSINTQLGTVQTSLISLDQQLTTSNSQLTNLESQMSNVNGRMLSLESLSTTIQQQIADLQTQTEFNTAYSELFKTILDIDPEGKTNIFGIQKFTSEITETGTLIIKTTDPNKKTIGEAIIPAGQTSAVVETGAVTGNSKIFVTAERPVEIGVNNVIPGQGFVVEIGKSLTGDLNVNWWIVEKK